MSDGGITLKPETLRNVAGAIVIALTAGGSTYGVNALTSKPAQHAEVADRLATVEKDLARHETSSTETHERLGQAIREARIRADALTARADLSDQNVRDFYRDNWPPVVALIDRVARLEEELRETRRLLNSIERRKRSR